MFYTKMYDGNTIIQGTTINKGSQLGTDSKIQRDDIFSNFKGHLP